MRALLILVFIAFLVVYAVKAADTGARNIRRATTVQEQE
jgi:hypothetical protein